MQSGAVAYHDEGGRYPPMQPGPKRYGQTRGRIMAVARQLFHERALGGATLDLVARESNLSRRTVYNHFASREALFRAVREAHVLDLSSRLPAEIAPDATLAAGLLGYARLLVGVFSDDRYVELLCSLIRDGREQGWLAEAHERHIRKPILSAIQMFVLAKLAKGEITGVDPARAAQQFVSAFEALSVGPALYASPGMRTCAVEDISIEALVATFLQGQLRSTH